VQFPGREPQEGKVLRVAVEQEGTDLALVKVDGDGYPFLTLAKVSPGVGADVVSLGYPSGHYARLESKVVSVGLTGQLDAIKTSHRANSGHSGGPLLNVDGELIGICSRGSVDVATPGGIQHTPHYTLWSRIESAYTLVGAAGLTLQTEAVATDDPDRPELQVWSTPNCGPCRTFKADFNAGKLQVNGVAINDAFVVTFHNPEQEVQEAQRLGIEEVPVFLTEDGARFKGYSAVGLTKFLTLYQKQLTPPPPVEAAAGPSSEPADSAPAFVPPPAVDNSQGAGLKAIVLVRKQELNGWQAAGVTLLERQAKGLIKTHLNEILGKYAEIEVVFERISPTRFAQLAAIVGLGETKKAAILLAVRQSYTGKGEGLLKYVEERVKALTEGKVDWQYATIEVVFERVDPEGYEDLCTAVESAEPNLLADISKDVPGGWLTNLMISVGTLITGIFTGTRRLLWRG
jgi:hypothetical protein